MMITMCIMCKVQVTVNQVVDMIAMGDGLMAAVGTMAMPWFMASTRMSWRAFGGIGRAYRKDMFVNVAIV